MSDSGFYCYTEYGEKFQRMTDAQLGRLIRSVMEYKATGEVPDIDDLVIGMAFDVVKTDIDKQAEVYRKRAEAGRKGGKAYKPTEAEVSKSKQTEAKVSEDKPAEQEEAKGDRKEKKRKEKKILNTDIEGGSRGEENAPSRHRYGGYGHVLLSDHDITALDAEYGHDRVKEAITYLDNYCESNGKTYKNYAQAMRNWVFKAVQEQKSRGQAKQNAFLQFPQNHYSAEDFAALVSN